MSIGNKTTPSQLWNRLIKDAGLELQLKRSPGRDADLELEVLQHLDPAYGTSSAYPTVKALLKADQQSSTPTVTVESLLVAVLDSQKGFAAMMSEILETLVMAEATLGETNLTIEFSYDELADSRLKQTLQQFRVEEERTRRVCASRFVSLSEEQRRGILNILSELRDSWPSNLVDELPLAPQVNAEPSPVRFRTPLLALEAVVADFLQQCRSVGLSREENFDRVRALGDWNASSAEQREAFARAAAANDFWDIHIAHIINTIKDGLNTGKLSADLAFNKVMQAVKLIPVRQQWINETYTELLDLLNLPTWKRRHELYSVWVGTRLLNVAKTHATQLKFHTQDKVLSFAFGGRSLASYETNGEHFSIKCEVRSELVGVSSKRKRSIQPDFRVFREGGTATLNDASYLVVECKHYLQQNVNNFSTAASDYARSCRYATVLVVNHGPIEEANLLGAVQPEVQNRARFIGNAMPNASDKLKTFFHTALFSTPATGPSGPVQQTDLGTNANSIVVGAGTLPHPQVSLEVEWDAMLQDIDLALAFVLETTNEHVEINYRNRGETGAPHFALLHEDVRGGPGKEKIDIYELKSKRYEVLVRNFSTNGHFPTGHLHGRITHGNGIILLNPPMHKVDVWVMAVLLVNADGTVTIQT